VTASKPKKPAYAGFFVGAGEPGKFIQYEFFLANKVYFTGIDFD